MRSVAAIAMGLVCLTGAAYAQVDARVELSPPVVPFHKPVVLTLVVESPVGLDVALPDLRDVLGEVDVPGIPDHKRELVRGDRVRVTERYVLEPVDIGDYVFAPIELTWGEDEGLTISTPALRVRDLTEPELAAAMTFDDAVPGGPGVDTGAPMPAWVWVLALSLLLIAAAVAAYVAWRRHSRSEVQETHKPAWELARERLALLAERELPQQGKYDQYFVDLSSILRYYIEGRFELHAPERTTPEFLGETSGKGWFTPEQEVFLARFLRLCDRVKFARFRPDLEEMQRSFEDVAAFVEGTVPRETSEDEEAVKAA